jgi:NAD(P)-dependent dehydrogenase (short-subunit alcohol dehydrogenase family)
VPETRSATGKVAVITGAATGIGAATARVLAGLGMTVVCADVDEAGARSVAEALGAPHTHRTLDVGDLAAWRDLVSSVRAEFGRLDLLHLNAGVMTRPKGEPLLDDPLAWFTEQAYRKVMHVNTDGVVFGIMAGLGAPGLEQIVVTASGAAILPLAPDPFYTTSKYAVLGLGLALEESLAARGIRIDVICPGAIGTTITAPDIAEAVKQESPEFVARCVGELATTAERGPVWLAFNEEQGLQRWTSTAGEGGALDVTERTG